MDQNAKVVFHCPHCGGEQYEDNAKTGIRKCLFCGCEFPLKLGEASQYQTDLVKAENLRNALEFDNAEELLSTLIRQYPVESELYYQRLLCKIGAVYVSEASDGKKEATTKPTLNRIFKTSLFDLDDYLKAIKFAATPEIKAHYESDIRVIDNIRSAAIKKSEKEMPYDIFICYKRSVGNLLTKDSETARKIYSYLNGLGYRVFFAEETLQDVIGQEYEPIIYNAIYSAKVMIVIAASEPEYITSPWVQNEWSRFYAFTTESNEKKAIVTVLDNGFDPANLPNKLSRRQAVKYDANFNSNIAIVLSKYCPKGMQSTIKKKDATQIEIITKPVAEVKIEKRVFGGTTEKLVLDLSTESKVKKIGTLIGSDSKHSIRDCGVFINQAIAASPDNDLTNWYRFLYVLQIKNPALFGDMSYQYINTDKSIFENLDKAIANADNETAIDRINKMILFEFDLLRAPTANNLIGFRNIYNVIIPFFSDSQERKFANDCISKIKDLIDKRYVIFPLDGTKILVETLYGSLTRLGTESIIETFDMFGDCYRRRNNKDGATYFYNSVLEIFAADPDALWGKLLIKNHSSTNIDLAKNCKDFTQISKTIEVMLKGGYRIRETNSNYFELARSVANILTIKGNTKEGSKLYKDLYSLIPDNDEYKEYAYNFLVSYPELLLTQGDFKNADVFFKEVLSKYDHDFRANWGEYKVRHKLKTNYAALLYKNGFGDNEEEFETLISAEEYSVKNNLAYKGQDDNILKFSELHNKIIDEKYKYSKDFIRNIKICDKICCSYNISVPIDYILDSVDMDNLYKAKNMSPNELLDTYLPDIKMIENGRKVSFVVGNLHVDEINREKSSSYASATMNFGSILNSIISSAIVSGIYVLLFGLSMLTVAFSEDPNDFGSISSSIPNLVILGIAALASLILVVMFTGFNYSLIITFPLATAIIGGIALMFINLPNILRIYVTDNTLSGIIIVASSAAIATIAIIVCIIVSLVDEPGYGKTFKFWLYEIIIWILCVAIALALSYGYLVVCNKTTGYDISWLPDFLINLF